MSETTERQDLNTKAIAILRIGVGILFLIFGEYKVFGTKFIFGGGFQHWIDIFLGGGAYPFMVPVLRNFVLAHATPIAFLVAYGEFTIGLALTFGLLVRPASACGCIYMFTLLFSSNYPGEHAELWQYFGASLDHFVLAICFVSFLLGHPSQAFSVLRFLPPKFRNLG
ncbi:MAG TPA: DoxX family membrane protein [Bacteroidota bacterium]